MGCLAAGCQSWKSKKSNHAPKILHFSLAYLKLLDNAVLQHIGQQMYGALLETSNLRVFGQDS